MRNLMAFVLVLTLVACSKDKNDDPGGGQTKTELLTSSEWKYENGGIDQDKNGTIDIPFSLIGIVEACMTDNTGKFNSDGSGVMNEGATKCDPADPQTTNFAWSFQNNENALNITGNGVFGLGGNFNIKTLSETSFQLSKDTTVTYMGTPMNVSVIFQLKH